jgi:Uma2 family endonuclease
MSFAQDLNMYEKLQSEDVIFPPSDLLSDEPPLETELHLRQMMLLIESLEWWWRERQDFYACGNLTIYYSPRQRKSEQFRGPDFFVVLNTERKLRKSWVVWEENGQYPNVIVEILSPKTAATDRGLKKQIYQDTFRTSEYFWFDPVSLEFKGFRLLEGQYQELKPSAESWLWSQQLNLYLGIYDSKLRFFTPTKELLPTPEEAAEQEHQRAEHERQRAQEVESKLDEEQKKAERMAQKLREMGIDPSEL